MNIPGFACNIGLEIHIQMNTRTKAFCRDLNQFGGEPNSSISEISLGYPGTLPMVNRSHIIKAIQLGAALGSEISETQYFDRKNYHYPDLSKSYQITQDSKPICVGGKFQFISNNELNEINIHHVHCEEDAGKSIHDLDEKLSMLDYNRAGTPLLEMVTEPDFTHGKQVHDFLAELQKLVRYLDISDGNMEEGSLRCDCNVSIRPEGTYQLGTRVEIKNLNSKKYAQSAIKIEAERQFKLISNGNKVTQQTRLFDNNKQITAPMRDKEEVNDYRYFPDPDIQSIILEPDFIKNISSGVSLTPSIARMDLIENHLLSTDIVEQLVEDKSYYSYFVNTNNITSKAKQTASFIINTAIPYCKENRIGLEGFPLSADTIKTIFDKIESNIISSSTAFQNLIPFLLQNPSQEVDLAIDKLAIRIEEDKDSLNSLVSEIISDFPDKVSAYRKGKKGLIGFFMGQAMKKGGQKILPEKLKAAFEKQLNV